MLEMFRANRLWYLSEGIALIILGALAMVVPFLFTITITLLFGCLLIVGGVVQAVRLTNMGAFSGKWIEWLLAIATLAIGVLMVVSPEKGALTLTALLILFFIITGIAKVILAFQSRDLPRWGWILVSGLLSFLLAGLIISGWPSTGLWALGLLLGVNLLVSGITLTSLAIALKKF